MRNMGGEEPAQYITVPAVPHGSKHEDGTPVLNRFSTILTRGHDFPGAQVCCWRFSLFCYCFFLGMGTF
jgi:hypothetical protein